MSPAIRIIVAGFFLWGSSVFTAVPAPATEWKVRRIDFSGNLVFSQKRLIRLMVTRPAGFLHSAVYYPEILNDDLDNLVNFYQQHGYLDAQVSAPAILMDSVRGTVDITIGLDEGELTRVEGVSVFGNGAFSDSVLLEMVQLRKGDPFRRGRMQEGLVAMLSLYANAGYLDAIIKPAIRVNQEQHRALIDFTVTEHQPIRIGNVMIDGLTKTKPYIVKREFLFREGQIADYEKMLDSQRQLYRTGLFSSVFIRPVPSAVGDSTNRDIMVEVKENLSSEFNVSIGYGSVERLRGKIELLTKNLAGTARQAGVGLTASFIQQRIEGSFSEPRVFRSPWRADVNLFGEYLIEPGYDLRRYGGWLTVGRDVFRHAQVSVRGRFEEGALQEVRVVEEPIQFDSRITGLSTMFVHDTRDNLFNPAGGTYVEVSGELAGSFENGTETLVRSILRLKRFQSWGLEIIAASALEVGWLGFSGPDQALPLSERFYAGGPNSIRGFKYQEVGPRERDGDPLGGKFKVVWNALELRKPLYKMIGGVVFCDAGCVSPTVSDFTLSRMRLAVGEGLRVGTPVGILRLDHSINLDRRRNEPRHLLFFSLGHAF